MAAFSGSVEAAEPAALLCGGSFSVDELATCVKVLQALGASGSKGEEYAPQHAVGGDPYKPFRAALVPILQHSFSLKLQAKSNAGEKNAKAQERRRADARRRAQERNLLDSRGLRASRIAKLSAMAESGNDGGLLSIPDGPAGEGGGWSGGNGNSVGLLGSSEGATAEGSDSLINDNADVVANLEGGIEVNGLSAAPVTLEYSEVQCYTCKAKFAELHSFYATLCPPCAALNWQKRSQTCDLTGRHALLTGGRIKVGFQIALKLLRAGCQVVVTTRFPHDAWARYRQEGDFSEWKDRLKLVGLDLRAPRAVESFAAWLEANTPHLDMIINNACQTIRRPASYYAHLLPGEAQGNDQYQQQQQQKYLKSSSSEGSTGSSTPRLVDTDQQNAQTNAPATLPTFGISYDTFGSESEVEASKSGARGEGSVTKTATSPPPGSDAFEVLTSSTSESPATTVNGGTAAEASAQLVTSEDKALWSNPEKRARLLPEGQTDAHGQQLDLRTQNSWLLKLGQVETAEAVEVLAINCLAPFVLNGALRKHLEKSPFQDRHIVNVSAMEGKFYRHKSSAHPHTNMAKAALNMMTRTSALDYRESSGIWMNAVDTGWINDENPLPTARRTADKGFQTPLDEVDAAARVLDPIFGPLGPDKEPLRCGLFLKDYAESEW